MIGSRKRYRSALPDSERKHYLCLWSHSDVQRRRRTLPTTSWISWPAWTFPKWRCCRCRRTLSSCASGWLCPNLSLTPCWMSSNSPMTRATGGIVESDAGTKAFPNDSQRGALRGNWNPWNRACHRNLVELHFKRDWCPHLWLDHQRRNGRDTLHNIIIISLCVIPHFL